MDAAWENGGALSIRRHHGVPSLGNEQLKKLIHQSTQTGSFDDLEIAEASCSILLDSVPEEKQHSLALKKHSANGLGKIENGPG